MEQLWSQAEFIEGSVGMFAIMLAVSLLYGLLLSEIYGIYFRDNEPVDGSLARSMTLLTPALMTIFWMTQISLPLSVGLLGTLAFVRFRAPVKRAEDIAFLVITMASSISCAIQKPLMGLALIAISVLYALLRNLLEPKAMRKDFAVVTYNTRSTEAIKGLEAALKDSPCKDYDLVSARSYDGITSLVINFSQLKKDYLEDVRGLLQRMDQNASINIFFPNSRLGV